MNCNIESLPIARLGKGFLWLIILTFFIVRFVNLNADFPLGLTWSGVLYTDEGWYTNAAIRHYLLGDWYLNGDFNPIINLPVGHVLQRVTFSIFGKSIWAARLTSAFLFILLSALTARLVYRRFGESAAMLTALLLATNYLGFAYSRLAIMEFIATFFVCCSLVVAAGNMKGKGVPVRLISAAVLLGMGILTKSTMVFGVPLLLYIAWWHGKSLKESTVFMATSALALLIVVGGYCMTAKFFFTDDYTYFQQLTFSKHAHLSFAEWLKNILNVILTIKSIGVVFVIISTLLTSCALLISQRYRSDLLVHILIIYIISHVGLLSLVAYTPPRYCLPLIVPFAGLCGTACFELWERLKKNNYSYFVKLSILPIILIFVIALEGSVKIIDY